MLKIFLAISIGFMLSYKKIISDMAIKINSKLSIVWLLLLIFAMGVSIGIDKETFMMLPDLGFKALLFAIVCISGSVAVTYVVSRIISRGENK